MHMPISFAALILSVVFLQLSSGASVPLDALSGLQLGFSTGQIGLLGSAHYVGFFVGCWWAPRLMGSVGHSRAFAAFTALGAMGLLAHMMVTDPYAWAMFRMATGLCIAGCYTVIEAWVQAGVTNETRGRVLGGYRVADLGASLTAQLMIGILPPAAYFSYNTLALLCCAALLPLTLTRASPPVTTETPRLEPRLAWTISPLAVVGMLVAALSGAAFRMVGPVYASAQGLGAGQTALFLASYVAGGALAQLPVGWLADRFDRRHVLIGLSAAAIVSSLATVMAGTLGATGTFLMAGIFGLTTYPIFSVGAAHAHDYARSDQRVSLSAALMFWFAVGAITAPWLASLLIARFGPGALFVLIAAGHAGLILYSLLRMRRRPAETRTPYLYLPRTSFQVGRLLARFRDPEGR
ncbi:MFS transporter [Allosediminivita pacifica]|uniref:Putative MFS family arabinose efflux permease n=1 Tax=Allosediminivita pacifica TaxID=1267769 RepID=A0A2T6B7T0_9RHOB|nr:MFS transporter [Allosediminivita pacifica]PTX52115.1 putative MFS family arabinose efflux permease [Allosediminivita pacifica]GGA97025.1 MFS transporter [Allosediminivita pacifica]